MFARIRDDPAAPRKGLASVCAMLHCEYLALEGEKRHAFDAATFAEKIVAEQRALAEGLKAKAQVLQERLVELREKIAAADTEKETVTRAIAQVDEDRDDMRTAATWAQHVSLGSLRMKNVIIGRCVRVRVRVRTRVHV